MAALWHLADAYTLLESADVKDGKCSFEGHLMSHGEVVKKGEPCESYECDAENELMAIKRCHYGVYQGAPPNCTLQKNPGEFPTCCPWPQCYPSPDYEPDDSFIDGADQPETFPSYDPPEIRLDHLEESGNLTTEAGNSVPVESASPSTPSTAQDTGDATQSDAPPEFTRNTSHNVPSGAAGPSAPPTAQDTNDKAQRDATSDGKSSSADALSTTVASVSSEDTSLVQPPQLAADSSSSSGQSLDHALDASTTDGSSPDMSRKKRSSAKGSEGAAPDSDCHSRCGRLRSFAAGLNSSVLNCDCI
ncbi:uncharacterized protein LOC8032232 [Ixodes scapularis]|uniref:uncharacterized protein LOC8032232 n=1 Tax=Ixodes scapularis TaxID=6945 RepID=UPI001A9EF395|nr:uncharacterized protein LOC8032232 [Ixodes scapularis]